MAPKIRGRFAGNAVGIIFSIMERHGLSTRALAEKLGCSKSLISRVRHDGYIPPTRPGILDEIRAVVEKETGQALSPESQEAEIEEEMDMADLKPLSLSTQYMKTHNMTTDPFDEIVEIFESRQWTRGMTEIGRAIERKTFIAVEAQVGWGKSTLKDALIDSLGRRAPYVLIAEVMGNQRNQIGMNQIMEAVFHALDVPSINGLTKERRSRIFRERLESAAEDGKIVCAIVDDAHRLPPTTFSLLKNFVEMQSGFRRLLGMVLIGQYPELRHKLKDIREAGWRARRIELDGLADETADYVKHRIAVSGARISDVITPTALERFAELMQRARPHRLDYPLPVNAALSWLMMDSFSLGELTINVKSVEQFFGVPGVAVSRREAHAMAEIQEQRKTA